MNQLDDWIKQHEQEQERDLQENLELNKLHDRMKMMTKTIINWDVVKITEIETSVNYKIKKVSYKAFN